MDNDLNLDLDNESKKEKKDKNIINQESAELEFEKFCESWDIDHDESSFNEEEKIDYDRLKRQIIRSIKKGRLIVRDDGSLTYIISKFSKDHAGQELNFEMPDGKDILSMNGYKENHEVSKNFAMLASVVGKPPQFFSKLKTIDINVLQAVVMLFLAG